MWDRRAAAAGIAAAAILVGAALPWLGTPLRRLVNTQPDGPEPRYDVALDAPSVQAVAREVPDDASYWIDPGAAPPLVQGNLKAATHLLLTPAVPVQAQDRADYVVFLEGSIVRARRR